MELSVVTRPEHACGVGQTKSIILLIIHTLANRQLIMASTLSNLAGHIRRERGFDCSAPLLEIVRLEVRNLALSDLFHYPRKHHKSIKESCGLMFPPSRDGTRINESDEQNSPQTRNDSINSVLSNLQGIILNN